MPTLITLVHIAVCLFLVVIVLLQHGKGADVGATFGGSGQSLFGTEGPVPLMNKVTTTAAIVFMMTSITLAYFSAHKSGGTVMKEFSAPAPIQLPVGEEPSQPAVPQEVTIPLPESGATTEQPMADGQAAPVEGGGELPASH